MTSARGALLETLGPRELEILAAALESGRLRAPFTPTGLARFLARGLRPEVAVTLKELADRGLAGPQIGLMLGVLARERRAQRSLAERFELVWSGPGESAGLRDTGVVVTSLCSSARRSVLLANYSFDRPRTEEDRRRSQALWEPLAMNMQENAELRVRLVVDVSRRKKDDPPEDEAHLQKFARNFRRNFWPWEPLPEVFFDPRALRPYGHADGSAVMHAKCVVRDEEEAFISSANFSRAGRERNIEVGVRVRDTRMAVKLVGQFERLIASGLLVGMPG